MTTPSEVFGRTPRGRRLAAIINDPDRYPEYRAFSRELLLRLPLDANSDDFVFDNEVLAQTVWLGYSIGEVSCPTSYGAEASSINFRRSVRYGFGCLAMAAVFRLSKWNLARSRRLPVISPRPHEAAR